MKFPWPPEWSSKDQVCSTVLVSLTQKKNGVCICAVFIQYVYRKWLIIAVLSLRCCQVLYGPRSHFSLISCLPFLGLTLMLQLCARQQLEEVSNSLKLRGDLYLGVMTRSWQALNCCANTHSKIKWLYFVAIIILGPDSAKHLSIDFKRT